MNEKQLEIIRSGQGFIAALDQSGGSTPKALKVYGISEGAYSSDEEMFQLVHEMRSRIIMSPDFTGDKILGAILFKVTMESQIEGMDTADYLWEKRGVVPFLKIDSGLAEQESGVQMMKPMPELEELLDRANEKHIFGTKMRSVIHELNEAGIKNVVAQQFDVARRIIAKGLVPIIEPEVNIHAAQKSEIEQYLAVELGRHINTLAPDELIMLKLTLPEINNLYGELAMHQNVVRVVALSGGYSREEAVERLRSNNADGTIENNMIASYSRALAEGLSAEQSDEEFNEMIGESIEKIYDASVTV